MRIITDYFLYSIGKFKFTPILSPLSDIKLKTRILKWSSTHFYYFFLKERPPLHHSVLDNYYYFFFLPTSLFWSTECTSVLARPWPRASFPLLPRCLQGQVCVLSSNNNSFFFLLGSRFCINLKNKTGLVAGSTTENKGKKPKKINKVKAATTSNNWQSAIYKSFALGLSTALIQQTSWENNSDL